MNRRFGALMLVCASVFAVGCGDDDTTPVGPSDTTVGSDATTSIPKPAGITYCTSGQATATRSGVTCVETDTGEASITQPSSCTAGDSIVTRSGLGYPWTGAQVGARSFECNACPNGLPELQGQFRTHGFLPNSDSVDYSKPDAATDFGWVLFVDGNTFYSAVNDVKFNRTTESRGYYFCSMKSENSAKHVYFVDLESSDPANVGGWTRTDSVLSTNSGNNLLIKFFDNAANTGDAAGTDFPFCRIGSTSDGQLCNDPFGG